MAFLTFTKDLAEFEGRVRSTDPKAFVSEKGVLSLNSVASAHFLTSPLCTVGYDGENRIIAIRGYEAAPANAKREQFLEVRFPNATEKSPNPPKLATIKVSNGIFGKWKNGAGPNYNFKGAGNQSFDLKVDEKTKTLKFTLPLETPAMKPKQTRMKKGIAAVASSTVAEPQVAAA